MMVCIYKGRKFRHLDAGANLVKLGHVGGYGTFWVSAADVSNVHDDGERDTSPPPPPKEAATARQVGALQRMLDKLHLTASFQHHPGNGTDAAARVRRFIHNNGSWDGLSKELAGKLIDEVCGLLDDAD